MVLHRPKPVEQHPLQREEILLGALAPAHVRLRVRACAVCRTDLHIVEGELPRRHTTIVPGHQIVGDIVESGDPLNPVGRRVGVSWLGGVDGTCAYCLSARENLCDAPTFTGYDVNGGYAEYVDVRGDFALPLPSELEDLQAAPLLCAGIIGFRALRVAGVRPNERVGIFGFGASAHLTLPLLQHWGCEVYVSTRGKSHQALARKLGATWVGDTEERPPQALQRAITFAPSGAVVVSALSSLSKGGVLAINAIHLDRMPEFDYDRLLWGERQIRSVTNMTRADAYDFLKLAASVKLRPETHEFPLLRANDALVALKRDAIDGAAVLRP